MEIKRNNLLPTFKGWTSVDHQKIYIFTTPGKKTERGQFRLSWREEIDTLKPEREKTKTGTIGN